MPSRAVKRKLAEFEGKLGHGRRPHRPNDPCPNSCSSASEKTRDLLHWLQHHTQSKDPHWREVGAQSSYRRFPNLPYFPPIIEVLQRESVVFCAKSRDLMLSWLFVAYFAHDCMIHPGVEVLF